MWDRVVFTPFSVSVLSKPYSVLLLIFFLLYPRVERIEDGEGKGERGMGKGERGKGKGEREREKGSGKLVGSGKLEVGSWKLEVYSLV